MSLVRFAKIPKIKPITVGVIYKATDQTKFLDVLSDSLNLLDMLCKGWHILGRGSECKLISDVNLYQNGPILEEEKKSIVKAASKVSPESEKYIKLCKTFVLKQLIKSPTRVTPNTSTLTDHILTCPNY